MSDTDFILRLDVVPDRSPELSTVGDALVAWSDMLQAASLTVDPVGIRVELVGVEAGSQRFKVILRRCENIAESVKAGSAEYSLVSKAAIALAGLIGATVVGVAVNEIISPDPRIPDDQMAVIAELSAGMRESVDLQKSAQRFYGILQDDPAIGSVELLNGSGDKILYQVPRSQFAERSGVWGADQVEVYRPRMRQARWEVTLIRAAFVPTPRRWTFARDGLEFSATMEDPQVLDAIRTRRLPIRIAEGVRMSVEIAFREVFDGRTWVPDPASRRIIRVWKPRLPPPSTPLFPSSDAP